MKIWHDIYLVLYFFKTHKETSKQILDPALDVINGMVSKLTHKKCESPP